MESYNFPRIVPQLVEDNSLKRARTTITEGGEEKEAIRVTSVGGNGNLDSQGVADAMGKQASEVLPGSVLSSLHQGLASDIIRNSTLSTIETNTDVLGAKSDAAWSGTGSGTLNAVAKRTSDDAHAAADVLGTTSDPLVTSGNSGSINSRLRYVSAGLDDIGYAAVNINTNTGTSASAAWTGTGNGTLISIGKRTSNDTHAAAEVLGTTTDAMVSYSADGSINGRLKALSNYTADARSHIQDIKTYMGSTSAVTWTGSGSGSLNAIAKRTSNDTNATATATGTQSDAAWSGTGDGTVIALLKGIYNKL